MVIEIEMLLALAGVKNITGIINVLWRRSTLLCLNWQLEGSGASLALDLSLNEESYFWFSSLEQWQSWSVKEHGIYLKPNL